MKEKSRRAITSRFRLAGASVIAQKSQRRESVRSQIDMVARLRKAGDVKEQLLASLAAEKKAHDEERLQSGEKLARLEEKLRALTGSDEDKAAELAQLQQKSAAERSQLQAALEEERRKLAAEHARSEEVAAELQKQALELEAQLRAKNAEREQLSQSLAAEQAHAKAET